MAVELFNPDLAYRCLSADAKPTNPSYDLLYETDTQRWYIYNGTAWVEYNGPTAPAPEQVNLAAQGLISQNYDRQVIQGNTQLTGGTVYAMLVPLFAGQVVTNIHVIVTIVGTSMTLSKCGLYTLAGARLGVSDDQGTAWESTGVKTAALGTPVTITTTGGYYVAIVGAGSALPQMARTVVSSVANAAIGSASPPWAVEASQTDLDATLTLSAPATNSPAYWVGLS